MNDATLLDRVRDLDRRQKQVIVLAVDLTLLPIAYALAFILQLSTIRPGAAMLGLAPVLPAMIVFAGVLSSFLGISRVRLNAYDVTDVRKTAILAACLAVMGWWLSWLVDIDTSFGVHGVFGLLFFLLSVGSRFAMLHILLALYRRGQARCRVLIYGAGTTGMQLASALRNHSSIDPVAFVDDNPTLQGLSIAGLGVHTPVRIADIVRDRSIDRVLLAMPSLSQPKQAQIARRLTGLGLEVQTLPSFAQLIGQEALLDKLISVAPSQLLGRARLDSDLAGGCEAYRGRVVLVTGAGGSIGSELCRQVLLCRPRRLVLFELSELALYTADQELRTAAEDTGCQLVTVLGSVADARLVRKVLAEHEVQVVLHAAAYKHVPLVETNPLAGLSNNVLGTATIAREAAEARIERFLLVSTDKAVRPTNIMGASKRLAEFVVQDLAHRSSGTVFTMVRFGNVLGSSGSVIPLFQEQIARGGPVTVTHPEISRYFMTAQEATRLVLLAGSFAQGGEVFVLDMGKPVLIRTLARQVIEASGYTVRDADHPDGDIEIVLTAMRPGEKMCEEPFVGEGKTLTPHPKILGAREEALSEIEVAAALKALRVAVEVGDADAARAVALRYVEGYRPAEASAVS